MNYPRMTHSSCHQMSSKPRFLTDGMGIVYMDGYFLLLTSPYSSLLELLIPFTATQHDPFGPKAIPF
jgi:hypothetical protein